MIVKYNSEYKDDLLKLGQQYEDDFEKKYLNSKDNVLLYVIDSKVRGFLITETAIDEASVILLYVDKDARRKKIASTLMDNFINTLTDDIKRIILEVSDLNISAINLYKKYGFASIATRKKYYKDGSDALVMERKIDHE